MNIINVTNRVVLPLIFLVLAAPCLAASHPGEALTISPSQILMGAQYNGVALKIEGKIPAGNDVIVRFVGEPKDLHLREKGKVFGLLWMNVGKVTMKNVPNVCLISSSAPLDKLGEAAAPYGLDALSKSFILEDEGKTGIDVPHELLQLKKKQHLFNEADQGIELGADAQGVRPFTATIKVPSALTPGTYQIETIALKNGKVTGHTTTSIKAQLIGFPKWLSDLAFKRSLLYGVLASVIAIFSGLAIGLVFQSKGAH